MKKRENPYQAVSIPKEALQKIKDHIKEYEYKNVADFIRIAIEDRIAVDTIDGADLHSTPPKKVTMGNLQKQLIEMQKDIQELKSRKKKKIFMM